jgi:hypothetical protein
MTLTALKRPFAVGWDAQKSGLLKELARSPD